MKPCYFALGIRFCGRKKIGGSCPIGLISLIGHIGRIGSNRYKGLRWTYKSRSCKGDWVVGETRAARVVQE